MDTQVFWRIIEAAERGDREEQCAALETELRMLPAAEIAAFDHEFDRQRRRSLTWELWGAAYIINGGCSDDGFDHFRIWLISLGRQRFERALADPEALADFPEVTRSREDDDGVEFEEFAYVAGKVHEEKTG